MCHQSLQRLKECNCLTRRPVVGRRQADSRGGVAGMDDLAAAYVDPHMIDIAAAGVAQQISRLYGIHRDLPSFACLISGASPSADAKVREHAHKEA